MEIIIFIAAFLGALLTFFSGFGLGTVLLPVMIIFLPPGTAILSTAIIHFINNGLKFGLIYKNVNIKVAVHFGVVAILGAFLGAYCISYLQSLGHAYQASWLANPVSVSYPNSIIGALLIVFAFMEKAKSSKVHTNINVGQYLGGALSGFFGGLSGHQGALRSLFLSPIIKEKNAFVATGAAIAFVVDIMRISVYFYKGYFWTMSYNHLILLGIAGALIGTILSKKLLTKITYKHLNTTVMVSLICLGIAMLLGYIH